MSYWIDPTDDSQKGGTRAFMADSESDIATLPTSSTVGTGGINDTDNEKVIRGSSCLCLENSTIYYLNSSDQWIAL